MAARGLKCPVVMEFQWDEAFGAAQAEQKWRYCLQLGFDQNGETTVSLSSRHIRPPGHVGRYLKSQRSGWHGSWKKLGTAVFAAIHYTGNEDQTYEHRIHKVSPEQFMMGIQVLVFTGLKTKYIYEKQLTDGVPTRFPIVLLKPIEKEEGDKNQKQYIFWIEIVLTRERLQFSPNAF